MACVFNKQLLHPRNWLTWFGLGILWLIVQLPYPLLHFIGTSAGRLSRRFLKRREHIARRNIELCFPDMSPAARETLIDQNFMSLGMGLIETGMAWFWSDERVKKWFDVEGFANLNHALSGGKGVMVVGVHFMSLELGGRAMGLCRPMMATYRPHNSPLMEWVQTRGRPRSPALEQSDDRSQQPDRPGTCLKIRRSGMVCSGPGLRPQGQRVCAVFLRPAGGNHQRHLCAFPLIGGENAEHQHGAQAGSPGLQLAH